MSTTNQEKISIPCNYIDGELIATIVRSSPTAPASILIGWENEGRVIPLTTVEENKFMLEVKVNSNPLQPSVTDSFFIPHNAVRNDTVLLDIGKVKEVIDRRRSNITSVEKAGAPKHGQTQVSKDDSTIPMYMWIESDVLYWWSPDSYPVIEGTLERMFMGCRSLKRIDGLRDWNISRVTNLEYMLCECISLVDISGVRDWNTKSVTNIHGLLSGCCSLMNIDALSSWDVSQVRNAHGCFRWCSSLSNLSHLERWNVRFENVGDMFEGCKALKNLKPLANWNIKIKCETEGMFYDCTALTDVSPLLNWDIWGNEDFRWMFDGCEELAEEHLEEMYELGIRGY